MLVVVINVVARVVWHPILGTYDWVQFLGAIIVGFAVAHCGTQGGHVAVKQRTNSEIPYGKGSVA